MSTLKWTARVLWACVGMVAVVAVVLVGSIGPFAGSVRTVWRELRGCV